MSSPLRRCVALSLAAVVALSTLAISISIPALTPVAEAAPRNKVKYEVCHRTNAIKNPYRRISVAWSAVDDNGNGHDNPVHDGPVFNVSAPQATHGTTPRDSGLDLRPNGPDERGGGNDRWGDIFYAQRQNQWNANNYFVDDSDDTSGPNIAGQAIFDGTAINPLTGKPACRAMSVTEYIASEREANPNIPMEDIMDELDEMEAAEDLPLKAVLRGSFSTWFGTCQVNCEDVSVISQAIEEKLPGVTTELPTNFSGGTTATLNGTVSPLGTNMQWYFEWVPTTPNFADTNQAINVTTLTTPAASTDLSPPESVSASISGLTAGTTYYYRTVGFSSTGSNTTLVESYTYGVIKQFNVNAPGSPTISVTCGNNSLTVVVTAPTTNAGGITGYEYSLDGGVTYATLSPGAGSNSLTGLTNGESYDVVVRAVAGSVKGLDSTVSTAVPCGTPVAVTDPASPVAQASTTIRGNLSGNGNALSNIRFIWGTDATLTTGNTTSTATPSSLPSTADEYPVTFAVTNLNPGTTYYYRVVGTYGASSTVQGSIEQFTIPASTPPSVTTEPATSVTGTTATINGTGTSNGASSTVTFTWGTDPTLTTGNNTATASQSPLGTGASGAAVSAALTNLTPGTTYYFRATISNANSGGNINGIIRQFTTQTPAPPSSPPSSAGTGTVEGTVWFDVNRNNRRGSDEPFFPGVDVELVPSSSSTGTTVTTDANGGFEFTQVQPGTYIVKAKLPSGSGVQKWWDTGGNDDWQVTVTVVAAATTRADFAAVGEAVGTGTVDGGGGGSVDATWSGVDGSPGTGDEVTFSADIETDEEFTLPGMPTGRYSVSASSRTGRRIVSAASFTVGRTGATLNTGALSLQVKIVAVLPATGANGLALPLGFSLMLLPAGVAATGLARRRRRSA